MAEYNRYHSYYKGNLYKATPGYNVKKLARDKAREGTTDAQRKYHANLIAFFKENGLSVECFKRPRNKRDCTSKINGMITILKKNGLDAEFFGRGERGET